MKLKTQSISVEGTVITIEYAKLGKKLSFDFAKFPEQIQKDAREHGFVQRFGDLESGDETGARKLEAAVTLKQHYENGGDWRMSPDRDTAAEVIAAVHRSDPKKYPLELLQRAVAAKPDQVKDWRAHPKVKEILAKTRAEKAAKLAKESKSAELVINV